MQYLDRGRNFGLHHSLHKTAVFFISFYIISHVMQWWWHYLLFQQYDTDWLNLSGENMWNCLSLIVESIQINNFTGNKIYIIYQLYTLYSGRINYNAVLNYNASMDFRRFAYGKLKNSIFFLNSINIQVIPRTCTKIQVSLTIPSYLTFTIQYSSLK